MPRPAGRRARQNPGDLVTLYAEVAPDIFAFIDNVAVALNVGRAEAVEEIVRHARADAFHPELPDHERRLPEWVQHKVAEQQLPIGTSSIAPARHQATQTAA